MKIKFSNSCLLSTPQQFQVDFFSYFYVSGRIRDFQRVTSWDCREPALTLVILQSRVALTSSGLFSIASGAEKGLPGETSTSQRPPKASPSPSWMLPLETRVNNKLDEPYTYFLILASSWFCLLKAKCDAAEDEILSCTVSLSGGVCLIFIAVCQWASWFAAFSFCFHSWDFFGKQVKYVVV